MAFNTFNIMYTEVNYVFTKSCPYTYETVSFTQLCWHTVIKLFAKIKISKIRINMQCLHIYILGRKGGRMCEGKYYICRHHNSVTNRHT